MPRNCSFHSNACRLGTVEDGFACFACFAFPVTMAPVGRTCASRGPRRCCFVRLPREPAGSERLMPCSGWSTPVYLQHGGLQSWSSLVLLASDRFGQPSRTSGNTVASRPRSQHCHLRFQIGVIFPNSAKGYCNVRLQLIHIAVPMLWVILTNRFILHGR